MKNYIFNSKEYNTLNALAIAYKENFQLGITDIYTNTKALIKFIKKRNRKIVDDVIDSLMYSKYKNSALTFVIFYLSGNKLVVINGEEFTYKSFVEALKEVQVSENNALYTFMEDFGITKTFKLLYPKEKVLKDAYYFDKYSYLDFTRKYLIGYHEYFKTETIENKITTIAINEECFRRGSKLFKDEAVHLTIAHACGFKTAIEVVNEKNPLFYGLKAFNGKVDNEYLRKLISDTFYWWLVDNLDKYTYDSKSIDCYRRIVKIKKEYDKYLLLIKQQKIQKISLDLYSNISRELYLNYLSFANYFKEGNIKVKKKFPKEKYELDKLYCNTLICSDYMSRRVVKLSNIKDDEGKKELLDSKEYMSYALEKERINNMKKYNKNLQMFNVIGILISIIGLAICLGMYLFKLINNNILNILHNLCNNYSLLFVVGSTLLIFITSIIIMVGLNKSVNYIDDYELITDDSTLSLKEEYKRRVKLLKKDNIVKKVNNKHIILQCITGFAITNIFTYFVIALLTIINYKINSQYLDTTNFINSNFKYLYYLIPSIISIIPSIFIKKKNIFIYIIYFIIAIISTIILLQFI